MDGINYVKLASIETKEKLCNETIEYVWNTADIPEGEVYVRFQAYDLSENKNALLEGGNEVIVKYIIDRTAPDRPENTKAYGEKDMLIYRGTVRREILSATLSAELMVRTEPFITFQINVQTQTIMIIM